MPNASNRATPAVASQLMGELLFCGVDTRTVATTAIIATIKFERKSISKRTSLSPKTFRNRKVSNGMDMTNTAAKTYAMSENESPGKPKMHSTNIAKTTGKIAKPGHHCNIA